MSAIATTQSTTEGTSPANKAAGGGRRYFHAPNGWGVPVLFMVSMSLVGLSFYPAWLIVLALLVQKFKSDRYEALIMTLILLGGYGLREQPTTIACVLIYAVALPLVFLLRKDAITRRLLTIWMIYAAGCLVFAFLSYESLKGQMLTLMRYLSFVFLFIPLGMFAGREFKFDDFFNRLYPYVMIFMVYYWIDGIILCGPVMMPHAQPFVGIHKFYSLYVIPFGGFIARVYPPGFYLALMLIYPLTRTYKLRLAEWVLVLGALAICRTFALITAVIIGFIICQKGFGRTSRYIVLGTGLLAAVYGIDVAISDPTSIVTPEGSKLRVASTITQFVVLDSAQDTEDLAEFGTGRMAQIIPKVERLYEMGLEWRGFGFLHPSKTENPKFMIENTLYTDIEQSSESVAAVEVIPVQVFLNMGYLGLAWHLLFLIALILAIRHLPDSKYAWTLMVMFIWLGISGFAGMVYPQGQMIVATAFAMVILNNRTAIRLKQQEERYRQIGLD